MDKLNAEKYGSNLRAAMKAAGVSGIALANHVNVRATAVSNWKKRGVSTEKVLAVAKYLGVAPGHISPFYEDKASAPQATLYDKGEQAMQIQIIDSAMAPQMLKGDLVVIDMLPGSASPADIVGARHAGQVIVRKLSLATGEPVLLPLNPDYPPIASGFVLLGKVSQWIRTLYPE